MTDKPSNDAYGYRFRDAGLNPLHRHLLPVVLETLGRQARSGRVLRVFELGCGNGSVADALSKEGYEMTGIDPSTEGIAHANRVYPWLKLATGSAYDDLAGQYGTFPAVVSLEVVEHLYYPRKFAAALHDLLEPGGVAIVSTPYHGYWKNLAMALSGKMDTHFTALWDFGHIKFWSKETLGTLLREARFGEVAFRSVGRIPAFAKSMVAVARKD
ncbi:MAG TPA: methyltransferase domain-containing protein [Candidatus Deferrimicrobiaceae bacterium]